MILKHGLRACELDHRLQKCKDICINNREELFKELRSHFLAPLKGSLMDSFSGEKRAEICFQDDDQQNQQNPLFVGEKLRVQISEYTNTDGLDENQLDKLSEIR